MKKMEFRNVILCISTTICFQKQLSFAHDFSKRFYIQEQIEPKSIIKQNLIYSSNILLLYTLLFDKCICKTEVGSGCTVCENGCKPYLKQASLCKMFQNKH